MSSDSVFRALADPSRRTLLDQLHRENGLTLSQMCQVHEMSRQAVTKHLGILEKANLLIVRKQGREKLHYLNPVPIHEITERWIRKYERTKLDVLGELKKRQENANE